MTLRVVQGPRLSAQSPAALLLVSTWAYQSPALFFPLLCLLPGCGSHYPTGERPRTAAQTATPGLSAGYGSVRHYLTRFLPRRPDRSPQRKPGEVCRSVFTELRRSIIIGSYAQITSWVVRTSHTVRAALNTPDGLLSFRNGSPRAPGPAPTPNGTPLTDLDAVADAVSRPKVGSSDDLV